MGSPSLKAAQKGLFAAILLRVVIIPPMVVIPAIASAARADLGEGPGA